MIDVTTLLIILFAHWVADFLFQTDNMALNKSSSNKWLLYHTSVYTLVLGALLAGAYTLGLLVFPPEFALSAISVTLGGVIFLVTNMILHTATDWVTSRITSYFWQKELRHWFFVTIGFDQFLHAAALILMWVMIF